MRTDPISLVGMIREIRKVEGLTQEQFAHKLGVTVGSANRWERAKRLPMPFLYNQIVKWYESICSSNRSKRGSGGRKSLARA